MGKKDENYWKDRATEREEYWYKQSREKIEKNLARQYRQSAQKIQDDIAALYGRFAKENGLSLKEATALLKGNEFKEWRYTLEEYNHLAQNNNAILKELNTLAMRSRISRLDKLYSQTLMELYKLGEYVEKDMRNFLSDAYRDNYYKGLFEIGKTAGIHGTISAVDNKRLEDVLRNPWSGKNYSARIWDNQKKLAETIKQTVFDSVHRGVSVPKLSKMVQDRMGVGKYEATRLVRTELNYVHNQANLDSIKDSGMEFYKFVATLDSRTSQKCRSHDGSIVPVEEASPGDNLPPLHPHCRSTIIGSLGVGKGGQSGKRIAKGNDGKTLYIPQQMAYKDYKAVYIDKTKPLATWAKEAGISGTLAKYTPKISSQGSTGNGIIDLKKQLDSDVQDKPIPDGNYNLAIRRQVQNRHIPGTMEHERYVESLKDAGIAPSVFYEDVDIKTLITEFHRKGVYDPAHDGSTREYVDVGRYIGKYWDLDADRLIDTTFIKIVYSKKGVHAYPIRPKRKEGD